MSFRFSVDMPVDSYCGSYSASEGCSEALRMDAATPGAQDHAQLVAGVVGSLSPEASDGVWARSAQPPQLRRARGRRPPPLLEGAELVDSAPIEPPTPRHASRPSSMTEEDQVTQQLQQQQQEQPPPLQSFPTAECSSTPRNEDRASQPAHSLARPASPCLMAAQATSSPHRVPATPRRPSCRPSSHKRSYHHRRFVASSAGAVSQEASEAIDQQAPPQHLVRQPSRPPQPTSAMAQDLSLTMDAGFATSNAGSLGSGPARDDMERSVPASLARHFTVADTRAVPGAVLSTTQGYSWKLPFRPPRPGGPLTKTTIPTPSTASPRHSASPRYRRNGCTASVTGCLASPQLRARSLGLELFGSGSVSASVTGFRRAIDVV